LLVGGEYCHFNRTDSEREVVAGSTLKTVAGSNSPDPRSRRIPGERMLKGTSQD
jgi:hypothetical protein